MLAPLRRFRQLFAIPQRRTQFFRVHFSQLGRDVNPAAERQRRSKRPRVIKKLSAAARLAILAGRADYAGRLLNITLCARGVSRQLTTTTTTTFSNRRTSQIVSVTAVCDRRPAVIRAGRVAGPACHRPVDRVDAAAAASAL